MTPREPQPSVRLQALHDQQEAAFGALMQKQLRAMVEEDFRDQQERLWRTFNDAYRLGRRRGRERILIDRTATN